MKTLTKQIGRFPLGVWIAFIALILTFLAWVMQAYSLLDWENAVNLGLQNGSFNGDTLDQALATKEKGEAIADLLWALPINILAILGIWRKKFYGFATALMEFTICVYFPLFYIFQIGNTYPETVIGAVILWGIPSLLGIIGLWINKNNYKI
jgi:hypothetical protein